MPPKAKKRKIAAENNADERQLPENPLPPILTLNEDCFLHLFSFLGLQNVIILERVCKHFKNLAEIFYKSVKTFDFGYTFTIRDWYRPTIYTDTAEVMCSRIGPYVENLSASFMDGAGISRRTRKNVDPFILEYDHPYAVSRMLKFCTKLEHLQLKIFNLKDDAENLASIFPTLKSVTLSGTNLSDDIKFCFKRAKNLESVSLIDNRDLKGNCLLFLRNLKKLNLNGCSDVKGRFFVKFCPRNPGITHLNITDCNHLNQKSIEGIVANFTNLKYLLIGTGAEDFVGVDYTILADLPNLTHLQIESDCSSYKTLLHRLAEKNQLEYFDASSYNHGKDTVEAYTQLRSLKVFRCSFPSKIRQQTFLELCSTETLEELLIPDTRVTAPVVLEIINRYPALKYLDLHGCQTLSQDLALLYLSQVGQRSQDLVINLAMTTTKPDDIQPDYFHDSDSDSDYSECDSDDSDNCFSDDSDENAPKWKRRRDGRSSNEPVPPIKVPFHLNSQIIIDFEDKYIEGDFHRYLP